MRNSKKLCTNGHLRIPENVNSSGGCKQCQKIWNRTNREKVNAAVEIWRKNHMKEVAERVRNWQHLHPMNEKQKLHKKEYISRWAKENPDKIRAANHKHRASVLGNGGNFTEKEWFVLCFALGFKCACCKKPLPLEADHIFPVSKGGNSWAWNIQPLCKFCNIKKGTKHINYLQETQCIVPKSLSSEHNLIMQIGIV